EVRPDPRWQAARPAFAAAPIPPADSPPAVRVITLPNGSGEEFARLLTEAIGRMGGSSPELAEQEKLSLRVRDDISRLSDVVLRLRAIKKQLDLRKELLKDNTDAKELLKESEALGKKL